SGSARRMAPFRACRNYFILPDVSQAKFRTLSVVDGMKRRELFAAAGLLASMAACSPAPAPNDPVSKCVASNFPSYNAKD
ncbi:hypothetical protein, partial [Klebsiella michiganensis]|uniref:hypothetical protein n=1 Tax=Klebsiella michiganensis TaxID=1134687 RepID=UPI001953ECA4